MCHDHQLVLRLPHPHPHPHPPSSLSLLLCRPCPSPSVVLVPRLLVVLVCLLSSSAVRSSSLPAVHLLSSSACCPHLLVILVCSLSSAACRPCLLVLLARSLSLSAVRSSSLSAVHSSSVICSLSLCLDFIFICYFQFGYWTLFAYDTVQSFAGRTLSSLDFSLSPHTVAYTVLLWTWT